MPEITEKKLQAEAYRLYQLNWIARHGESVSSLLMSVLCYYLSELDESGTSAILDTEDKIKELCRNWENDEGFRGEIWACFDEFLDSEYKDEDYMRELLPNDLFNVWKRSN